MSKSKKRLERQRQRNLQKSARKRIRKEMPLPGRFIEPNRGGHYSRRREKEARRDELNREVPNKNQGVSLYF